MGSNKDDKRKQSLLQTQQEQDRLERQRLMGIAGTPPALETPMEAESLDWFNSLAGKNGPLDVTKLKGAVSTPFTLQQRYQAAIGRT
jgi:hypothetical protein